MAKIPVYTGKQRMNVSSPVSIRSASSARASGNAISAAGQGVQQMGEYLQRADQADQILQAKQDKDLYEQASTVAYEKAKRLAKPDLSDFDEHYQKELHPQVKDITLRQRSGRAKDAFESFLTVHQSGIQSQLQVDKIEQIEQHEATRMGETLDNARQRVRLNPGTAQAELMDLEESMFKPMAELGRLNATKLPAMMTEAKRQLGMSALEGMIDQEDFGTAGNIVGAKVESLEVSARDAVALGMLSPSEVAGYEPTALSDKKEAVIGKNKKELDPQMSEIFKALTADDLEKYADLITTKSKAKKQKDFSDAKDTFDSTLKMAVSGKLTHDVFVKHLNNYIDSARAAGVSETALSRSTYTAKTMFDVGTAINKAHELPPGAWQKLGDQITAPSGDIVQQEAHMSAMTQVQRGLQDLHGQRMKQGAEYIRKHDDTAQKLFRESQDAQALILTGKGDFEAAAQATQKYVSHIKGKQKQLGMTGSPILTPAEKDNITVGMRAAMSKHEGGTVLNRIQALYGDQAPTIIEELADHDKSLSGLMIASHMEPSGSKKAILESLATATDLNKATDKATKDLVQAKVDEITKPFVDGISQGQRGGKGLGFTNSVKDLVALHAKSIMHERDGIDADQAVQEAYKTVVTDTFQVVPVVNRPFGAYSSNTSMLIAPRQINGKRVRSEHVEAAARAYSKKDNLKTLGVAVPDQFNADFEEMFEAIDAGEKEGGALLSFSHDLEVKDGQWGLKEKGLKSLDKEEIADRFYRQLERNAVWRSNKDQTGMNLFHRNPENGKLTTILDEKGDPIELGYLEVTETNDPIILGAVKRSRSFFGGR